MRCRRKAAACRRAVSREQTTALIYLSYLAVENPLREETTSEFIHETGLEGDSAELCQGNVTEVQGKARAPGTYVGRGRRLNAGGETGHSSTESAEHQIVLMAP